MYVDTRVGGKYTLSNTNTFFLKNQIQIFIKFVVQIQVQIHFYQIQIQNTNINSLNIKS